MRGGYQIVDFKENNITSEATTIEGIYETIEGTYSKPLLFCNLMFDGVEFGSRYCDGIQNEGGSYKIYFAFKPSGANGNRGYMITVTNEDKVTSALY